MMSTRSQHFKLSRALILILEMTALVSSAFGNDNDSSVLLGTQWSSEDHVPCHHLEAAFERLRSLPAHLHPEALQSGSCPVGNDASRNVWSCPETFENNHQNRSDFHLGLYCEDVELLFSLYNENEMKGHPRDFIGFDYQSWCKCSKAQETMDNSKCDLCSDGMILKPNFLNAVFNDQSNNDARFRLTCAEASEYAKHITKEARCNDTLEEARAFCCEPLVVSSPIRNQGMKLEDFNMTLIIMMLVTALAVLLVYGSVAVMELFEHVFLSRRKSDTNDACRSWK